MFRSRGIGCDQSRMRSRSRKNTTGTRPQWSELFPSYHQVKDNRANIIIWSEKRQSNESRSRSSPWYDWRWKVKIFYVVPRNSKRIQDIYCTECFAKEFKKKIIVQILVRCILVLCCVEFERRGQAVEKLARPHENLVAVRNPKSKKLLNDKGT
jgi:hypothetical protein